MKQTITKKMLFESYEGDVTLRDGSTVQIRSITQKDEKQLLEFFRSLSSESKWVRFFTRRKNTVFIDDVNKVEDINDIQTDGLIAIDRERNRIIGHATYIILESGQAEAAFAVTDDYQGRGLGTVLFIKLAQAARSRGLQIFEAEVMPVNQTILNGFQNNGFQISTTQPQAQYSL
jgi:GNAT superfamily N-acetyltransferase